MLFGGEIVNLRWIYAKAYEVRVTLIVILTSQNDKDEEISTFCNCPRRCSNDFL